MIEYIFLAYNGVTYFSAALHAGYFFSEITYIRPKGNSAGMLGECDELPLNIPLTSMWEARAWAACGVLCRPIFDCSSGQQIKIHSFSKNKETSKIHKQKLSEIYHSISCRPVHSAREVIKIKNLALLMAHSILRVPILPPAFVFFWEKLQMPHNGAVSSWKSNGGALK